MRQWMVVVCALFAFAGRADTFGDVKSAVGRLTARQAVRATYAAEVKGKASGKFANEASARTISIEVAHDANGVTIAVPQALVEKASRGSDDAARNAVDSIRPIAIVEALDYRGPVPPMLNFGTVVEENRVAFRGRRARLSVAALKVPPRKDSSIVIGSVKPAADRLSLWIGDDNLPLAAERTTKPTA